MCAQYKTCAHAGRITGLLLLVCVAGDSAVMHPRPCRRVYEVCLEFAQLLLSEPGAIQ